MADATLREIPTQSLKKIAFMTGKALASAMVFETYFNEPAGASDIVPDFRGNCKTLIPQNNCSRKYLEMIFANPDLLDGFSSALTNLLVDGFDRTVEIAEAVASVSYEACHTFDFNEDRYTEPSICAQFEDFGFADLARQLTEVSLATA